MYKRKQNLFFQSYIVFSALTMPLLLYLDSIKVVHIVITINPYQTGSFKKHSDQGSEEIDLVDFNKMF